MQKAKQKQEQAQEQTQDLGQIIDSAYLLDAEIKTKKKALDQKKGLIKEANSSLQQEELSGDVGLVRFTDDTKSDIDPKDLLKACQNAGDEEAFFDLIKVKITDARKRLGEINIDPIMKSEFKPLSKITFKKKSK